MGRRVAIVGGGVMGSALAYFLTADPAFDGEVTIVERDTTYARASSSLSASSVRCQFSNEINVRIGLAAIEFLRAAPQRLALDGAPADIGLCEPGYLFLATEAGAAALARHHALQTACGADVALLDPAALAARFPWLDARGIASASLGLSGEGWFDGPALHQAFQRKARAQGARLVRGEATGVSLEGGRVREVRLADSSRVPCDLLVDAAGPWAARVAAWFGVELPVRARRRTVFVVSCPTPLANVPLVIEPNGVWFRPEGRYFLCGVSPEAANDPDDAPLEPQHREFDEIVWPTLATRVPAFEALRVERAWAGYYEYNVFDRNGIVGPAPGRDDLLLANGFSGHGIQQSPVVGRALAEWIATGAYRTLDLSPLGYARIARGAPLAEANIV